MTETTQTNETDAKELAAMFAPDDASYVFVCPNCKTSQWKQQDCKTTRAVRNDKAKCADCGTVLIMARDDQEDDQQ